MVDMTYTDIIFQSENKIESEKSKYMWTIT